MNNGNADKLLYKLIQNSQTNNQCIICGVTSSQKGEGKTTICQKFARDFANKMRMTSIVLVDMNPFNSNLSKSVTDNIFKGWNSSNTEILKEIKFEHPSGYSVVPLGMPDNKYKAMSLFADIQNTDYLKDLVQWFRTENSMIFLDLPPLAQSNDALILAPFLDEMILVVSAGTKGNMVASSVQSIEQVSKKPLMGCIFNRSIEIIPPFMEKFLN